MPPLPIMPTWLLSAILLNGAAAYHWPDYKVEYADHVLFGGSFLSALAIDCTDRDETTFAAQWVRLAYHDMSTHNVDDGTGGLDASIAYELDRAENIGSGMADSITDFVFFTSPANGLADLIAMGTVIGVAACGGPIVPFRAGRVDALAAGPPGVPEPQQDLESHTESFRRQGFTQSEMIGLVACGHTLGGVRREDFPEVIHDTSVNFTTFDSTVEFDNRVVAEYLDGTTNNPLVTGPNSTTNSDLRIFSSDGNATMQSIASSEDFRQVCSSLFEKMINTVPNGVELSDIVEPIEYKVGDTRLYPNDAGSFTFTTSIRVLSSNPQRKVTLLWGDRQGSVCGTSGCSADAIESRPSSLTYLAKLRGLTSATQYSFRTSVNMTSSISKFWFQIDEGDGSEVVVVDNGGSGYEIDQDLVLLDMDRSKRFFKPEDFSNFMNLVIAVRGDVTSQVSITTYEPATSPTDFLPKRETLQLLPDERFPAIAGFTFFSANTTGSPSHLEVQGTVNGQRYKQEFIETGNINFAS
ncbi:hypothetical protein VNI00_018297 [Paramarasmius palmivorus]|uniref:Peroxidase n=1 Tax=Paramarasmius palmivorus TaxID=297713 RepID=A0AAW0AZP1_9AGAR